jgi:D-methionine transport system substrate-binding protein
MKKILTAVLTAIIAVTVLASCSANTDEKTISVAATPAPHAEILAVAKEILAEKNVTLEVIEFTDYVQPNNVVESGEIDANYFQHTPYLDDFNAQNGTHIVSAAAIHVEPMGLYGGKQSSLDALK